jgi:hypothetical protein
VSTDPRDWLIDDDADESVADAAERHTKTLVPWLPDPHQCECGAYCDTSHEYVAEQADYLDVWHCPECDRRYHRDRV